MDVRLLSAVADVQSFSAAGALLKPNSITLSGSNQLRTN